MLKNFVKPELRRKRLLRYLYFQQDGATSHTCGATMAVVEEIYGIRIIFKNGYYCWPPQSLDLNACDYFLWGYLKQRVYATKVASLEELKVRIQTEIVGIQKSMLKKVFESFEKRVKTVCKDDKHNNDVIFKTK